MIGKANQENLFANIILKFYLSFTQQFYLAIVRISTPWVSCFFLFVFLINWGDLSSRLADCRTHLQNAKSKTSKKVCGGGRWPDLRFNSRPKVSPSMAAGLSTNSSSPARRKSWWGGSRSLMPTPSITHASGWQQVGLDGIRWDLNSKCFSLTNIKPNLSVISKLSKISSAFKYVFCRLIGIHSHLELVSHEIHSPSQLSFSNNFPEHRSPLCCRIEPGSCAGPAGGKRRGQRVGLLELLASVLCCKEETPGGCDCPPCGRSRPSPGSKSTDNA